jgi:hypothetical protein
MAEALGATGTAQVVDLGANGGNEFTPAYAIYENGRPARLALVNFMNDPSGASAYTAVLSIGGGETGQPGGTPGQVWVKYLLAQSVAQKGAYTWAGQVCHIKFYFTQKRRNADSILPIRPSAPHLPPMAALWAKSVLMS